MGSAPSSPNNVEKMNVQKLTKILCVKLNISQNTLKKSLDFLESKGYVLKSRVLGRGGQGVILRGSIISTKQKVAIKMYIPQNKEEYFNNQQEFETLKKLNSPYIVKAIELVEFHYQNKIVQFFIMEYCAFDLESNRKNFNQCGYLEIYNIALNLVKGLEEIHSKQLIHLDIKPKNIVLGYDNKWKFIDLGVSQELQKDFSYTLNIKGMTLDYSSPEQYQVYFKMAQNKITQKSDIYSLGLVFLLLTDVQLNEVQLKQSKIKSFNFQGLFNPEFNDFNKIINQMIEYQPSQRITLDNLYQEIKKLSQEELLNIKKEEQSSHAQQQKEIIQSASNINYSTTHQLQDNLQNKINIKNLISQQPSYSQLEIIQSQKNSQIKSKQQKEVKRLSSFLEINLDY